MSEPRNPRWSVEVRPDVFEVVMPAFLQIEAATLIFRNHDGQVSVAYAPGAWITVSPEATP